VIEESFDLTSTFLPDDSVQYTFTSLADFSDTGKYAFKVYAIMDGDIEPANDTVKNDIYHYGLPENIFPDIAAETLEVALPYTLDAGEFSVYSWEGGGSDRTYEVTTEDSYKVTVTDENNCSNSRTVSIDDINQVQELADLYGKIIVYPNPATDEIRVFIPEVINHSIHVELLNNQGQLVMKQLRDTNDNIPLDINVSGYAKGIYILRLFNEDNVVTKKIIIE